ncbi:MAG: hypothetical protein HC904_08080 [Blastochloris sp.]|nr:hypothetical protein [Blastochloris sp.]
MVARFGSSDKKRVSSRWEDAQVTDVECIDLVGELDHGLDEALKRLAKLGLRPQESAIDLTILATLIFGADTRVPRSSEAQDGWTREIEINLPVSDVTSWDGLKPILERALKFLTGDFWYFAFRPRPVQYALLASTVQPELREFSCVSLFSGGLDSYIGAVDALGRGETPLFVSHYLSHTSKNQKLCMDHLKEKFHKTAAEFFRARIGFETEMIPSLAKKPGYDGERTERSRSFLFFSIAALAASSLGKSVPVLVPENGLIALNVPLDRLRVGALSTRTTHPFFIARFNEIVRILGINANFVNPYRFKTKGEMARNCADPKFIKETAKDTISCSSPGKGRYQGNSPGHCGHCMPCLIRRASLVAAFGEDTTPYTLSKLKGKLNSKEASGTHIRSFQVALEKLRSSPRYSAIAVSIPGPLTDCATEVPRLIAVYERGMNEVGALLNKVKTAPL